MRVAFVHEHLVKRGGAEKVLKDLLTIWPKADVFSLVSDPEFVSEFFGDIKIKNSFIQKMPFSKTKYNWYLALDAMAIEKLDFSGYDLVISNNHSFSKGIITRGKTRHICYCHTPTRWIWLDPSEHIERSNYPFFIKWFIPGLIKKLKKWDYSAAQRPDIMVGNSKNVKKRIKKYYNRDSYVIWPAIDTEFFKPTNLKRQDYYFYISRLEPHKKPDLAVEAFNRLGLKLKVAGNGSMMDKLKEMAKDNIEFLGEVSQDDLKKLFQSAQAVIFPQEEDFGLVPLEAQACGTPVIAYGKGGALETVIEGKTGVFFNEDKAPSLVNAVRGFNSEKFSKTIIRKNAEKFSFNEFKKKWMKLVKKVMTGKIK